jgi:very-short-patch-repair endonuclease
MSQVHNINTLLEIRKNLRSNGTEAEALLWRCLQKNKLKGRKFRRQHSIGNYVVDFYCAKEDLVIELDGAHHFTDEGREYDMIRDKDFSCY